jgi:SAM-dependent methyltransferase
LPDPTKGTKEIYRTLKPGGIALLTTIRNVGWAPPFQKAQERIKPGAPAFEGMVPPSWAKAQWIEELLKGGGFKPENVEVKETAADMSMLKFAESQQGVAKMARNMIVKGWSDDEAVEFDKALEEELEIEEKSGIPRQIEVWVGIATK